MRFSSLFAASSLSFCSLNKYIYIAYVFQNAHSALGNLIAFRTSISSVLDSYQKIFRACKIFEFVDSFFKLIQDLSLGGEAS